MNAPIKVGDIMYASWGYEQTNIDFFRVTKRNGDWLTMQPLKGIEGSKDAKAGHMTMRGTVTPGEPTIEPPIRRRVCVGNGREIGCKFKSYGWMSRWEGRPMNVSHYA